MNRNITSKVGTSSLHTAMDKPKRSPWSWIPSLYFAEGMPYIVVMSLSVVFYKRMGISNTDIALYTSWLYLPWVIKPLWSPVVDILQTKRFWIVTMQLMIGAALASVALTLPMPGFFQYSMAFFWLLAFSSATHDIAADGFYLLGLSKGEQAFFIGIRSTFYRFAMLTGQGVLVILAGYVEDKSGLEPVYVQVHSYVEATSTALPQSQYDKTDMYFIAESDIYISTETLPEARASSILRTIELHNIKHGFYRSEENAELAKEDGFWRQWVSEPLGKALKSAFADTPRPASNNSGNIGIVSFRLSQKLAAGQTVILNFSFDKGDKSIALAKAYRYQFSEDNWHKTAYAAVLLDPELDQAVSATFVGRSGNITLSWAVVFGVIALFFFVATVYHRFVLPKPAQDKPNLDAQGSFWSMFLETFSSFFRKPNIGVAILFLLLYRLAESQIVKMASPFLLDAKEAGGLGITTGELGWVYGTAGMIALTLGGILGGIVASWKGLKFWLWWMAIAMNLPNLAYVLLAIFTPDSLIYIAMAVVVEQFGYGFGFTAYMLFMIYIAEGKHKTAHYALTTGFMALGMMIPGMMSGWLQESVGYLAFFVWVLICTLPGFLLLPFLKIDKNFAVKQ